MRSKKPETTATWYVVHATGKLEGMTWEGKYMNLGLPPVPNVAASCNHEWDTYSVK